MRAAEAVHGQVIPANMRLAEAELMLAGKIGREVTLRNALRDLKRERDMILIDCPPTLGLLSVNALVAADHALLTTEAQYFSLQGVEQAMEVVDLARDSLNPELELLAVVLNIANMRTKHARQTLEALRERFGDKVCRTVIRQSIAYAESAERAVPILDYRPDRGADYLSLAGELLRRLSAARAARRRSTSSRPSSCPRAPRARPMTDPLELRSELERALALAAREAQAYVAGARRRAGADARGRGAARRASTGRCPRTAPGRPRRSPSSPSCGRAPRPGRAARASSISSWAAPRRRRSGPTGSPRPSTRSPSPGRRRRSARGWRRSRSRWLRELFELPPEFGGVLVTGATMANFTGLIAARGLVGRALRRRRRRGGARRRARRRVILTSGYVHPSAVQAIGMLGLGRANVRTAGPRRRRAARPRGARRSARAERARRS